MANLQVLRVTQLSLSDQNRTEAAWSRDRRPKETVCTAYGKPQRGAEAITGERRVEDCIITSNGAAIEHWA